ncbi:AraC family transcriptional regulator [Fibrisoma montanum]|uniref:AraC family transcriptional regulator n=1 Tax=Fibrisoma montanum TaxID=2305895 RepID=A0A418M1A3_9BACT|nr:AraC family transcriptional regulator [Fibrisoma montanum]RIV19479.1 AraC family transcriptional regulator [Fibrisoma montanum]
MKRLVQFEPLLIQQLEATQWAVPVHTHDYYELIIIRQGLGFHTINGNRFSYSAGDVFLLGPSDTHFFCIEQKSQLCLITFTDSYLEGLINTHNAVWKRLRSVSLHTMQGLTGSLITNPEDQQNLNALLAIILTERNQLSSVMTSLMGALLNLIERQLTHSQLKELPLLKASNDLVQGIIAHICRYITEPDQLRIEQLGEIFHYSPGHLSALFKQQVGTSLQQYIMQYKLGLVEKRLRLSSQTISQIADEFGFTDICHLNKLFKRYYSQAPLGYRRDTATFALPALNH